ncbi:MAG: hypothetical protein Q8M07_10090, partial [Prosthecobacter sp.]|nr:hypothetical protein [Prosthecobacter sp.]
VFVLRGYAWVPSVALAALARLELHIPCPSDIGNATGDYRANRAAAIRQQRAYADFLASHADGDLRLEAEAQIRFCDELLSMLKRDACPHVISAAMNVAYGSSRLRTLAESELLRDIITKHAAPRSRKPDRTGMRSAVEQAYLVASEQRNRAAKIDEVLAELTANFGMNKTTAGYQIGNHEFDKFQLRNWLSRIVTRHRQRFPKKQGPGRPRKLP